MSQTEDRALVADAMRRLYEKAQMSWPPVGNGAIVPVPLDRLIRSYNLEHDEVRDLSHASAGTYLARWGIRRPELMEDSSSLAGFLFANASSGYILVHSDDRLPRRRFTAAHELGHYLLHFLPRLQAKHDPEAYLLQDDRTDMVREEENDGAVKALSLPEMAMERQANRFAAELLMPEALCRAGCEQYGTRLHMGARSVEGYLARDLLVSPTAMHWRLLSLNLTT